MAYFFDTYAIIEIIRKNSNYLKYKEEILTTSVLNVGELFYFLSREYGEETAESWHKKLENIAMPVDLDIVIKSMKFRSENKKRKLSFVDCVGYTIAKDNNLVLITGDEGFNGLENVEILK